MNPARTIDLTRAMSHPARRRALRRLHDDDQPFNALELERKFDLPVDCVTYHLQVLGLCRTTKPAERQEDDPTSTRHRSVVSEDRWVRDHLAVTRAEDEAAQSEGSGLR